jgi:hypothetical protein
MMHMPHDSLNYLIDDAWALSEMSSEVLMLGLQMPAEVFTIS